MSQPNWNLIWSTDTEALYVDETGVYDPELAILEEYETRHRTTRYLVFRFPIPRLHAHESGSVYDGECTAREWFSDDLDAIAETCDHASIREDLCSEDPSKRAHAYSSITGYHSVDNFDSEPCDLTKSAIRNWPDLDSKPKIRISVSDDDDGTVTLYCDDVEAARDDQSVLGESRWEISDRKLAYVTISDRADLVTLLEADGWEVDDSEWTPPDDQDFRYWQAKYERENGATPEALRATLGWGSLDDVRACRRVQNARWWTDSEREAYERACFDAGFPLDADEWIDRHAD